MLQISLLLSQLLGLGGSIAYHANCHRKQAYPVLSCLQKDRIHTLYPTPHTAWTRLHPTATPSLTNSREHPKRHARNKQEIWWHIVFRKNHSGKAGKLQTLQQLSGSNYPGFRDPQPTSRPERTSAPHMFSDSNSNKSSAYQPRHHHAILRVT